MVSVKIEWYRIFYEEENQWKELQKKKRYKVLLFFIKYIFICKQFSREEIFKFCTKCTKIFRKKHSITNLE